MKSLHDLQNLSKYPTHAPNECRIRGVDRNASTVLVRRIEPDMQDVAAVLRVPKGRGKYSNERLTVKSDVFG